VTSAGNGTFHLSSVAVGVPTPVTISGPNHVTRRSFFTADGSSEVVLDVIEESALWNLDFYRELVRDGAGGGSLETLNPWTVEPQFYVDTRPESGSGREIPDESAEIVVEAIGVVVPLLTNDLFRGDQIEVGTDPPADLTPGTVVIRWDPVEISQSSGAASGIARGVGGNASVVVIRTIEETRVIYHELGHVLGLFHPLGGFRPSLMNGPGTPEPPHFTDWDIFHARITYKRPRGNTDIDNDPAGFSLGLGQPFRTTKASRRVVICPPS
jgi:hypothetical protein